MPYLIAFLIAVIVRTLPRGAFFVNAAILVMSAAVFSGGRLDYSLESAHQTLTPLSGSLAGVAFAIALVWPTTAVILGPNVLLYQIFTGQG